MIYLSKLKRSIVPQVFNQASSIEGALRLNLNELPYDPSPRVKKRLETFDTSALGEYCSSAQNLAQIVAQKYGLGKENVLITSGVDNSLGLCFATFFDQNDSLALSEACNGEYRSLMHTYGIIHKKIELARDGKNKIDDYLNIDDARGILICNPNFPTSQMISRLDMVNIIEKNSDKIIIVDESYGEFSNCSVINFLAQFPNLIILKSFTKAYGLAGVRCGFALGNQDLIAALKDVQTSLCSFPDDTLAQVVAGEALQDDKYLNQCVDKILKTRSDFSDKLIGLGFEVLPSNTNFVLAKTSKKLASEIAFQLRENKIIVKTFKTLRIADYLLITIGTDEQMNSVCAAMKKILN
ncbi:MAG: histidinol-phosphate transaminase [Clostridia bacterium]